MGVGAVVTTDVEPDTVVAGNPARIVRRLEQPQSNGSEGQPQLRQRHLNSRIPFLELGPAYAELQDELDAATRRVMASGQFILGPEVTAFEEEFAAYCGAGHAIGVGSGLDALRLILLGYGVGRGRRGPRPVEHVHRDLARRHAGGRDAGAGRARSRRRTTSTAEAARGGDHARPRRRSCRCISTASRPTWTRSLALGRERGISVVEDAAQAHGARYRGRRGGRPRRRRRLHASTRARTSARYGDAGAVTTNDDALAERVRLLRNYGSS